MEMTGAPHVLTAAERSDLARMEDQVERHEAQHLDVGRPLREIRDKRLYRETHARFEDYCRDRWGMPRQTANRYIRAVEVVQELEAAGLPAPRSERQARPLGRLSPEARANVAVRARDESGFRGMSAARVAALADEVAARQPAGTVAARPDLVLVARGGRAYLSRTAARLPLRLLLGMAALADRIQALGPYAVEDALAAWSREDQDRAWDAASRIARPMARFGDAWARERGEQPDDGQQALPLAA